MSVEQIEASIRELPPGQLAQLVEWLEVYRHDVITEVADLSPSLRQRILELSSLKPNWDGETAEAPKYPVLMDVVETLKHFAKRADGFREPFLAPTFDGYVQMEWHGKKRLLEFEAVSEGWSLIGTLTGKDGKSQYLTAECERGDFEKLGKYYEWFADSESTWPSL